VFEESINCSLEIKGQGIVACCRITYYHWKIDTVAVIQLLPT